MGPSIYTRDHPRCIVSNLREDFCMETKVKVKGMSYYVAFNVIMDSCDRTAHRLTPWDKKATDLHEH